VSVSGEIFERGGREEENNTRAANGDLYIEKKGQEKTYKKKAR